MSSTSALIAVLAALPLVACVAPEDRLTEFEQRVVDSGPVATGCGETARVVTQAHAVEDISGEFLLAIAVSFASNSPLQFRCATTLTPAGDGGTVDLSCTPLTVDGRVNIGEPLGDDNVPVGADGSFCPVIAGTVPGDANPISGSDIVTTADGLALDAVILDADGWCGSFTGAITQPFMSDINGTFGAVRITPGAEGADLPEPVKDCPL